MKKKTWVDWMNMFFSDRAIAIFVTLILLALITQAVILLLRKGGNF